MARTIENTCINCGLCENVCPVHAIYGTDTKREVDAEKCIDCVACEFKCPVKAIHQRA